MSRLGHIAMLRSSVAFEWLFGLAAVAAVSLLGTLPPLVVG
jgi:putative copper resistance protein D